MAETHEIELDAELGEHKVVRDYIQMSGPLLSLIDQVNQAEITRDLRAEYLTRIVDELSNIARVKYGIDKESFDKLMVDWEDLDEEYGTLNGRKFRLKMEEWRERKGSLIRLRERLGMGTSPPTQGRDLSRPLRMADYHRFCTVPCDRKKEIISSRKKWQ